MVGNRNYCERNNNPQTTTFMGSGVDTIFERGRVNDDNNFRQLHIGTSVDCSQQTAISYNPFFLYFIYLQDKTSTRHLTCNNI